jgi:hypothetical protein
MPFIPFGALVPSFFWYPDIFFSCGAVLSKNNQMSTSYCMRVLIVINFEFDLLRCVAGCSLNSSRRIGTAIPGTPVINT